MGQLMGLVLIFSRLFLMHSHCLFWSPQLQAPYQGAIAHVIQTLTSSDGLVCQDGFLMAPSLVDASHFLIAEKSP